MDNRRMTDEQKTGEAAGGEAAGGEAVDFRKDTPPTDWLAKRMEERCTRLSEPEVKSPSDCLGEFIRDLSEQQCKPDCANGNGGAGSNGQFAPGCVCSLVEQLASLDVNLVVPKGEFLAVVQAVGYSQEDALTHYRNYAEKKQWDKYEPEFERLNTESNNAFNWWRELDSNEAFSQFTAADAEMDALGDKMYRELDTMMSA